MKSWFLKKCGKVAALTAAVAMVSGSTAALAAPWGHGHGGHVLPPHRIAPTPPRHHSTSGEFITGAVLGAALGTAIGGALSK